MGKTMAPPAVAYEDRPRAQERLALLPRAANGGPFAAAKEAHGVDLEAGIVASRSTCSATHSSGLSDELEEEEEVGQAEDEQRWQVLWRVRPFQRLASRCDHRRDERDQGGGCVLELVQLNGANFGMRWRRAALGWQPAAAPRWMVGPHWYLMATTWSVFALLALVVTVTTLPLARRGETALGVLLSTACLLCYALVGLSDPGIVPRISSPPDDSYTYCDQCESFRPDGALHCMDCRVCIAGYDHHCPWTGKCVGRGNARYFYAWLLLLVLAFVYEVIEFTTYMLPPTDQPLIDSSDDSFDIVMPSFPPGS